VIEMKPVDIFHIGPQKSGTTWIYRCLKEHPEIACPPSDSIHYFDMFYSKGRKWYSAFFADAREGQKLFDPTPSYIRSPWAARRIAEENRDAKIVVCLRNPVERAFSHFWHEKKKRKYNFEFSEVLRNYDLFSSLLETGFYAEHIERYLRYFPKEQILCQLFEELGEAPEAFLVQLLRFLEVDDALKPSVLLEKVNVAGHKSGFVSSHLLPKTKALFRRAGFNAVGEHPYLMSGKSEYLKGPSAELRAELAEICEPEIARLEALLGLDLRRWRVAAGER
jgi:hypothetical protein